MTDQHVLRTSALQAVFDRPIAFHPVFARLADSISAGLMLSQAFYWASRTHDPDGWFYKSQDEWEEETCLTRRQQETARKKLRELGVLEEQHAGMPAKLYFRVNYEVLTTLLNQDGGKRQPRMAESAILGCTKPPSMVAQNRTTKDAQNRHPYITEITPEITPEKKNPPIIPQGDMGPPASQASLARQESTDLHANAARVLTHLNTLTGSRYTSLGLITTRLRHGATVEDCCLVLDFCAEVLTKEQPDFAEKYLNQTTPFRENHFDKYLQRARRWDAHGRCPVSAVLSNPRTSQNVHGMQHKVAEVMARAQARTRALPASQGDHA